MQKGHKVLTSRREMTKTFCLLSAQSPHKVSSVSLPGAKSPFFPSKCKRRRAKSPCQGLARKGEVKKISKTKSITFCEKVREEYNVTHFRQKRFLSFFPRTHHSANSPHPSLPDFIQMVNMRMSISYHPTT